MRLHSSYYATRSRIIAAIIAAAGCNSASAPKTHTPTTGSLGVSVVAPTGVTGSVTVTGPAG